MYFSASSFQKTKGKLQRPALEASKVCKQAPRGVYQKAWRCAGRTSLSLRRHAEMLVYHSDFAQGMQDGTQMLPFHVGDKKENFFIKRLLKFRDTRCLQQVLSGEFWWEVLHFQSF